MQKQKGQQKLKVVVQDNPVLAELDTFDRPPILNEAEKLMENEGGEVAVEGGLKGI
jgi:hypothetical protein